MQPYTCLSALYSPILVYTALHPLAYKLSYGTNAVRSLDLVNINGESHNYFTLRQSPSLLPLCSDKGLTRKTSVNTLYGVQHIHINLTLIHCAF